MTKYIVSIGNMNGQTNYTVNTKGDSKRACALAWKRHKELGRSTDGVSCRVVFSRPL